MEFIKENDPDFTIMGRYKYVFSSDSTKQFYFNTPCRFDTESKRWFSQFQYTYPWIHSKLKDILTDPIPFA